MSKKLTLSLYKFIAGSIVFIQNFVIKWIYKPMRNWLNPSPYCAPVTPSEFYSLLEENNVKRVKAVLGAGRNPNALVPDPKHSELQTGERKLPLTVAVTFGKKDMVEVLVRHGASPFKIVYKQKCPLELAADLDKVSLVEAMLRLCLGLRPRHTVVRQRVTIIMGNTLYKAVKRNNSSLCRLLLQYGADAFSDRVVSYWQVFSECFENKHSLDWRKSPNAFTAAVNHGHISIVRSILQSKLDSIEDQKGKLRVYKIIHQSIIDVAETIHRYPKQTQHCMTLLREIMRFWCARKEEMESLETDRPVLVHCVMICSTNSKRLGTVYTLLDSGMAVNTIGKNGGSALYHAILQRKKPAAILLLKYGADVNLSETNTGMSPLMTAVRYPTVYIDSDGQPRQDLSLVKLLVEHGASLTAKDFHGNTVLSHAVQTAGGKNDIIKYLLKLNAPLYQPLVYPHPLIDKFVHQRLIEFGLDVSEFCIDMYYDFTVGGTRFVLNSGRHFRQAIVRQIPFNFMYMGCWISDEFNKFFRGKDVMARALDNHGLCKQGIQMLIDVGCDTRSLCKLNRYPRLHPAIHADPEFRQLIQEAISTAPTLQHVCRLHIRRYLSKGLKFRQDLESLEIPNPIKLYLTVPELSFSYE